MTDNLRGAALMVAAMLGFALEDMVIKLVSERLPVSQILVYLGLSGGTVFALIVRARGERLICRELLHPGVILRNTGEILGTIGVVMALATLPLSLASTIFQAIPFVVTLAAALILGEAVGWRRWMAVLVGFAGVLIVLRPGAAAFDPNTLWALLGVVGLAFRDVITRRVPKGVSSMQLSAWAFAMIVPAGLLVMPVTGGFVDAAPVDFAMMAAATGFGVLSYYAITVASRIGEFGAIAPFRYSRIVFALIIGAVIFGERPDLPIFIGAALIIGSGLYTFGRERRRALSMRGIAR